MRVSVLTAVSRPENLGQVASSLAVAAARAPEVELTWRWLFDLERTSVGGQAIKNELLSSVPPWDWVWVLDDDTLAHEDVLLIASRYRTSEAIIFSQQRSDGRVLVACPEHVVPGMVDIGQAFLRRELIGYRRIPIDYNGDGMFLQEVLEGAQRVAYHTDPLSLHNAISGVEVGV